MRHRSITALREAQEEVGLDIGRPSVVGELEHLSTIVSKSYIVPVVATLDERIELRPRSGEADRVMWTPVAELTRPGTYHRERWGIPPLDRPLHFFHLDDETVWGVTARMLVDLLTLPRQPSSERDAVHRLIGEAPATSATRPPSPTSGMDDARGCTYVAAMTDTSVNDDLRHPRRRAPLAVDPAVAFSWSRVAGLFTPHRGRVAVVGVLVVVGAVLGIVNPLLIQRVFDDALFGPDGLDLGLLWVLVSIMISVAIVSGALGVVQTIQTNALGQLVLRQLRDRLYRHLQTLSLSFFSGARTGDLQSRLSSDVSSAQNAVTSTLSSILSNGITFASALVAMFILSWQLTVVTLLSIPLFVLATRAVGSRREQYTRHMQTETAEMSTITQETLSVSGITLAKLFGRQDREVERFTDSSARLSESAQRQQVIGQAFFTVIQTFLAVTPIVVYLAAGYALNGGSDLTAGTIVAFTTLQNRLFFPVARMLETFVELQSSRALFGRIFCVSRHRTRDRRGRRCGRPRPCNDSRCDPIRQCALPLPGHRHGVAG